MGTNDFVVPKGRPFIPYGPVLKRVPPGAKAMIEQSKHNYTFEKLRAKKAGGLQTKVFKPKAFVRGKIQIKGKSRNFIPIKQTRGKLNVKKKTQLYGATTKQSRNASNKKVAWWIWKRRKSYGKRKRLFKIPIKSRK